MTRPAEQGLENSRGLQLMGWTRPYQASSYLPAAFGRTGVPDGECADTRGVKRDVEEQPKQHNRAAAAPS
jgi:hypothetical protein